MSDKEKRFLEKQGFSFSITPNGYSVHRSGAFLCAAHVAEVQRKTASQRKQDCADNLRAALSHARDRFIDEQGDRSPTQHPPPWYVEAAMI